MQDAAETRTSAQIATPSTSSTIDEGRFVPGTLIVGRYRIISLLGRGGMGEVYRATDLTLGQPVALKFLPNTGDGFERMLERFQNEVRVARQVSHPNVCRVYDLGEFEGMPYMSMEYVDGEDLSGLLSRIGRLPADKALDIARKLCAGLAAAHDKGVIHRDLKPANIMLDKRGNAIIMDFGLAAVTNELRGAEARSGSPAYQAPEQLRGEEVTAKSDIYALGLVLYELFTGKRAYEAKSINDLIRVQEEAQFVSMTSIAADIDPGVEKAIRRCLNPVAAQRPSSALSVSGLLPGGDPLAAALAAGEMPSPELVAAAGPSEGLKLKYSVPLALSLAVFILATPFLRYNREMHSFTPLELPPDALVAKIREYATSFGYPDVPADRAYKIEGSGWAWQAGEQAARKAKSLDELRRWYLAESPLRLSYRESPMPMTTTDATVTAEQPAPVVSGMIDAWISTSGQLRRFVAVPSQLESQPSILGFDPSLLSRATGFDLANMEETAPAFTPLHAFDWQKAWKGKHPKLDVDFQVEAAAWHGKLTHLLVVSPNTVAGRMPVHRERSPRSLAFLLAQRGVNVLVYVIAAFLAIRNLRANRSDRRGAFRLGVFQFALLVAEWTAKAHWTADIGMMNAIFNGLGEQLLQAASIWLLYVALEPSVRARWPKVLVSWNRILIGRWNDPRVATRVLQGVLTASAIAALFNVAAAFQAGRGQLINPSPQATGASAMLFFADLPAKLRFGIEFGLVAIFAIFLLRTILRRDWIAALAGAILITAVQQRDLWDHFFLLDAIMFAGIYFGVIFVLLRLGLVATIVTFAVVDLFHYVPGAQSLTKWYEWTIIAYPAILLAIVAWAFWRASGEQAMRIGDADATTGTRA